MKTPSTAPSWKPDPETVAHANVTQLAAELGIDTYENLHRWSAKHRAEFWGKTIDRLGIRFRTEPDVIVTQPIDPRHPEWLPGARLNIVESCFQADPAATAVIYEHRGEQGEMTFGQLEALVDRVAHGLHQLGLHRGSRVAIAMPMTVQAVAGYLGIVKAGGVVVSIADSFAPGEIQTRLELAGADAVITQGAIHRGRRTLPMYAKVLEANAPRAIVVEPEPDQLREGDLDWEAFLGPTEPFEAVEVSGDAYMNILFSSGTTGTPKAIPWTHLSPIKSAMDAHFHHDVHPGDVLAWPTNLGWMMGPWLIYASLINRAAMALFDDAPTERWFGEFIEEAEVTMLGVVPSLVRHWRETECMEELDWSRIRAFSSTGEASNRADMRYLMSLAGGRPVIEYCGGTELGGGYITGTVVQPCVPAAFSTPALGIDTIILDEAGEEADVGEIFLVPPSIGFSAELLNRDHDEEYYAATPPGPHGEQLRRHGDYFTHLEGPYFRASGRVDDTMNLGGIKVSSAEIERIAIGLEGIRDAAAISVPIQGGGPSKLIVYVVGETDADLGDVKDEVTAAIRTQLNPLFKVHSVIPIDELPRTASNKVKRRELRTHYLEG
ncbi:MAG: AMP-binding protein [Acidimicrobiia bacterium]|nr:AMP-binding protein [Acidimicrobiia bacterium]MBT8193938.1 AMP-binding protein [Acidimicrobiia bacterium]NNF88158.1 AMP-binding protein [Acidimicrobiia bacterium]NNL13894.1 AMP-binding protein [Acidimicrobiia bacterium]NNL97017.1 AMP-binding protein [Acidimicrobiia bacterium]